VESTQEIVAGIKIIMGRANLVGTEAAAYNRMTLWLDHKVWEESNEAEAKARAAAEAEAAVQAAKDAKAARAAARAAAKAEAAEAAPAE